MNKKVLIYDPEKHQEQLQTWFKQWKMNPAAIDILPKLGTIIENVCAVFLYETNSSICFIESLISNKELTNKERDEGLKLVCNTIILLAKQKGFKYIMSYSKHTAVADRACNDHGFKILPDKYHAFMRSL